MITCLSGGAYGHRIGSPNLSRFADVSNQITSGRIRVADACMEAAVCAAARLILTKLAQWFMHGIISGRRINLYWNKFPIVYSDITGTNILGLGNNCF